MKLVTWNTQWCCGNDGITSPQRIIDGAHALQPGFDVLCLQEISINYPRLAGNPGHDQVEIIRSLLPGFQVFFGAAVDEFEGGERRQFGNLVATRLPVTQVQHHTLPYPADAGVRSMPRMCTVVTVRDPVLGPVRVMTTHLEYFSTSQRMAQAQALRQLHIQACEQAAAPPEASQDGSPFQGKEHTAHAVLCGDFNLAPSDPEYSVIQAPHTPSLPQEQPSGAPIALLDSWKILNGQAPHTPTFHVHNSKYSPTPVACDFVFVSDSLKGRVSGCRIDSLTQASDHQPVAVTLA